MSHTLHHTVTATSQDDVLTFERNYADAFPRADKTRLLVQIFGRPSASVMKKIFADQAYLHAATGEHGNLYFMGYAGSEVSAKTFDVQAFVQAQADLENQTKWRYSGETDLVVLNSRIHDDGTAHLDYENALCLTLERAIAAKAIASEATYLQTLIARMKSGDDDTVTTLSDLAGWDLLKSATKKLFVSIVPKDVKQDAAKAFFHVVSDISRDASAKP